MTGAPFLGVLARALRFRWAVLLAVLVPAAAVGVLAVETRADDTTAVAVVGVAPESADVLSTDAVQLALGRYSVVLTSPEVLREVASETGISVDVLDAAVDVTASQEAGNLAVRATLPSTDDALLVARAVAEQTVTLGEEDPLADATVLSGARTEAPGLLSSTRALQALLVLAALLAALVVAYALEAVRPRTRTGGDAAGAAGGPVLGSLPAFTSAWPRRAVAPDSEILASARSLRSGFLASASSVPDGPVVVVGAEAGAGASTVSFLLARTLADRGQSTLVVDLDLDHAGLSATMGTPSRFALHDALTESAPLAETVHREGAVAVLTTEPLSGVDDLVDRRLPDLLKRSADRYDVVLCDSAPLGAGELSEVVAGHAASAVVVVRAGTSTAAVARTATRLQRLGVPVRGVVLNHATRAQAEAPGLRETGRGG
ncbi:Mrp family chromosome partitioning ATPase [Nocardioides salarius]|uniref:Mrp family chromosome partitioning ATPase n=1 Tax=Nocardioides salarius TaxID=374513 RepID=A0ABS2MFP9_9ACTN|nr:division plane positioning ATPase MipZ [Nocardioides salarius]MBM7510019.1 Mrp family chromosome partitioning ATPase [Nocardioides salarius]